jgi:nucleoside 2-deoxyribosyltransferase
MRIYLGQPVDDLHPNIIARNTGELVYLGGMAGHEIVTPYLDNPTPFAGSPTRKQALEIVHDDFRALERCDLAVFDLREAHLRAPIGMIFEIACAARSTIPVILLVGPALASRVFLKAYATEMIIFGSPGETWPKVASLIAAFAHGGWDIFNED